MTRSTPHPESDHVDLHGTPYSAKEIEILAAPYWEQLRRFSRQNFLMDIVLAVLYIPTFIGIYLYAQAYFTPHEVISFIKWPFFLVLAGLLVGALFEIWHTRAVLKLEGKPLLDEICDENIMFSMMGIASASLILAYFSYNNFSMMAMANDDMHLLLLPLIWFGLFVLSMIAGYFHRHRFIAYESLRDLLPTTPAQEEKFTSWLDNPLIKHYRDQVLAQHRQLTRAEYQAMEKLWNETDRTNHLNN